MIMMKPFRMVARNTRDAIKSIFRNFSLSIASISCITITLILVSLAIMSSYNVRNFTDLIKKDFTIIVFLDNSINDDGIKEIEEQINKIDNIADMVFQGKQEIADSMMRDSDIFKNIMKDWDKKNNPLRDTLTIKVKDTEKIGVTANSIKDIRGVSTVKYGEEMVDKMLAVFRVVEKVLIAIVLSLILVTAFLISNTIKLTIFSRRKEIEIMRLVGASNINIEIPFIVEGLFLGFLGSIIPIAIVIYGYTAFYNYFVGHLFSPFIQLVNPEPFIYFVSLLLLGVGILVGMFGSFRAARKYLKI